MSVHGQLLMYKKWWRCIRFEVGAFSFQQILVQSMLGLIQQERVPTPCNTELTFVFDYVIEIKTGKRVKWL